VWVIRVNGLPLEPDLAMLTDVDRAMSCGSQTKLRATAFTS
jgi:hypothetical protein